MANIDRNTTVGCMREAKRGENNTLIIKLLPKADPMAIIHGICLRVYKTVSNALVNEGIAKLLCKAGVPVSDAARAAKENGQLVIPLSIEMPPNCNILFFYRKGGRSVSGIPFTIP
ncbi:MAG TPA: hypothetical protein VF817_01915 [Patescibacteria group bacterium]